MLQHRSWFFLIKVKICGHCPGEAYTGVCLPTIQFLCGPKIIYHHHLWNKIYAHNPHSAHSFILSATGNQIHIQESGLWNLNVDRCAVGHPLVIALTTYWDQRELKLISGSVWKKLHWVNNHWSRLNYCITNICTSSRIDCNWMLIYSQTLTLILLLLCLLSRACESICLPPVRPTVLTMCLHAECK